MGTFTWEEENLLKLAEIEEEQRTDETESE